jgi:lysophospholipase L1-like esterase
VSRSSFIGHLLPLVVSIAAIACSSSTTTENGSGGKGSGGVSSSGGTGSGGVGSGGTQTGVGGKVGTGGAATGGTLATGGTSTAATGGVTGKGGVTGAGGTSGEGGGAGSTPPRDGGPGGRTAGDGGPGRDGGAPGGRTGSGSGGQVGGSTGTTPTGGTSGNGPCKASPCVILPLGDSITHGLFSSDSAGYRSALFKAAVAANQNITFIGSQSSGPSTVSGKTFPKNHEGHDGITITGIGDYVPPKKAFTTTPHIVLVHIGTNDMTSNADPTTASKQLDTLVTNLVAGAPDALIVVAKIVPLGYSNTNYTSYIAKIQDVVKTHAGKSENVIMVDMSTLPSSDIRGNGDVHPTDKGYADMGNLWYEAIKGYLPN